MTTVTCDFCAKAMDFQFVDEVISLLEGANLRGSEYVFDVCCQCMSALERLSEEKVPLESVAPPRKPAVDTQADQEGGVQ